MRRDIGRELRVARVLAGLTQREVAGRLGRARSHVSRVEHGRIATLDLTRIATHASVVGLKPWLRMYPAIGRPLDAGQLALFERLRARLAPRWSVRLEVPMPGAGDLRAADATIAIAGCTCMVELITRLADFQAQIRAARLKQRDLKAERVILAVAASVTNRRMLRSMGTAVPDALPVGTKATLRALSEGVDPGADGLVIL
jgi:transcriptional regulator with XRE-family HTH domain